MRHSATLARRFIQLRTTAPLTRVASDRKQKRPIGLAKCVAAHGSKRTKDINSSITSPGKRRKVRGREGGNWIHE
eukprot:3585052-Amphidinium_carterae.3